MVLVLYGRSFPPLHEPTNPLTDPYHVHQLCMFGRSEAAFVLVLHFYNIPASARTTRSLYTALDHFQFDRQSG